MEPVLETAPEVQEEKVLRLRDAGFDWLTEQLAEVGKKAKKLGMTPPVLTVVKDEVVSERDRKEEHTQYNPMAGKYEWPMRNVRYRTVEVTGEIPKLNGWELLAVVEHTTSGNILKKFPMTESELEERFKHTTTELCEHCNVKRQRNETFIVEDTYGIQMQIGRSCLKDFTGHKNPLQLAAIATMISELMGKAMGFSDEDGDFRSSRQEKVTSFQDLLGVASAVIRVEGGYKKANATGGSTSNTVRELMYPTPYDRRATEADKAADRAWRETFHVQEEDASLATEVYEWAKNQPETVTEYMWNVRVLANEGWLHGFRNWGIACSVVQAYLRQAERTVVKEAKPALPASIHQGTVGQKLSVQKVSILCTQPIESEYGTSLLFVLQSESGAMFNWFCSGQRPVKKREEAYDIFFGEGDVVTFTGTVKGHGEYRDEKVTKLTRVKFSV